MAKFHWTNPETAVFGEYFLANLLEEARFAIYGDGVDLVDPDGAWRRLYDWWKSIPYEKRPPQLSDYKVQWGEVTEAVIRGFGEPRKYFSDFVHGTEFTKSIVINGDVLAEIVGKPGGKYTDDHLSISFVTGYVGDKPLAEYVLGVPRDSTVAVLDDTYSINGEWFDHMLGILAVMGFSIVRVFKKLPLNDGRVFSHHGKYVTTWWLRGEPDDDWDTYNGDRHPEIRILGSRIMTGRDSGFMYTGDDDWGNTWAYVYQSSYDNTESQINVDEFVEALNEVNPDCDDWRCGSVSGAGKPTPYMITARMYDDNGQITAAYAKCAELLHDIESEGCLNYDEFYKQEGDYTAECIQRVIEGLDEYDDEGRGLLPGHPEIEKIVQSVWNELSDGQWSTGNLDDFVLEDEQVLTALRNLNLIDATKFDEWEFCPIEYRGWSKWTSQRYERSSRKPERVLPSEWVGEAYPTLTWNARDAEGLKFEVAWTIGDVEGLAVTTDQFYRLSEPLPLHLGEDVWFSWKVRAILPDNYPTEWTQGYTYNMFQARTGKQSPDAA